MSFYYFNIFYLSLFDLIMTLAKRRTFYMLLRNVLSQFLWLNVLKTTSFSNNNNNNNNNNNIIIIYYYFYCDCDCFVIVNCCCYCYYILLQYSNCLYPQLNNTQKDDYMYLCYSLLQRVGYLAASQSFHEDLDILMLTTNMIRKVLISWFLYRIVLVYKFVTWFLYHWDTTYKSKLTFLLRCQLATNGKNLIARS